MKQPEIYKDGWLIATPQQRKLQEPIVKSFLGRQYNNCTNKASVITGAEKKSRRIG